MLADSLFGPANAALEAEIRWLAENATPISEAEVAECFRLQRPFRNRSVLVTFDDAYRDNFDVAAPLLKKYSVPAIFFVPIDSINLRKVGWWDEIAWAVKSSKREIINVAGRRFNLSVDDLVQVTDFLIDYCQRMQNDDEARRFVGQLRQECNVTPVPYDVADSSLMTWEQIGKLPDYGVSVGGHTMTHPVLASMTEAAQRNELVKCKEVLEEKTGRRVLSVAYPYGAKPHFGELTKFLARNAGFQLGFTLVPGTNRIGKADAFGIRRILAPADADSCRLRLASAALGF